MTIYTGGARTAPIAFLEQQPVSTSSVLDAFMDDPLLSPTEMIRRFGERGVAQEGMTLDTKFDEFSGTLEGESEYIPPKTEVLSVDQQNERIKSADVPIQAKEGLRSETLDILIEAKQEEIARGSAISRATAGQSVLGFVGALGASALDPINVASAFVPVFPALKYGNMLASATSKLGRAGVRMRVGAIEGAVGAALVEPITFALANDEQADYTLADTMMNLTLGSALGGGLHMGAGAIGDAITKGLNPRPNNPNGRIVDSLPLEQRQALMRVGVALALDDRIPNIGILDPLMPLQPSRQVISDVLNPQRPDFNVEVKLKEDVQAIDVEREARARNAPLVEELDNVSKQLSDISEERVALTARTNEVQPLIDRVADLKEQLKTADKRKSKRLEMNIEKANAELGALGFNSVQSAKTFVTKTGNRVAEIDKVRPGIASKENRLNNALNRKIDDMLRRDTSGEGIKHRVESIQTVSNLRQYDPVQLQRVDDVMRERPNRTPDTVEQADAELQATMDEVAELADELGLDMETIVPKELIDELAMIDRYEQALRSLSACSLR